MKYNEICISWLVLTLFSISQTCAHGILSGVTVNIEHTIKQRSESNHRRLAPYRQSTTKRRFPTMVDKPLSLS